MARGASRAVSAEGLAPSPDDRQTAEALAQVVEAAGEADVVVMGDARDAAGVAGALAAYLGLSLVAGVRDFAADPDDPGRIVAHRKTDKTLETLPIAVPALITVSAVEDEKNVPSMKQMLAAKKAPAEKVNCTPKLQKWEAVQGRGRALPATEIEKTAQRRPQVKRARIFDGPVEQAVKDLVAALCADGIL